MSTNPRKPTRGKMQAYRLRLRNAGLRPVQIWVPDVKAKGFTNRLRRQVSKLDLTNEDDALDFIGAASSPDLD